MVVSFFGALAQPCGSAANATRTTNGTMLRTVRSMTSLRGLNGDSLEADWQSSCRGRNALREPDPADERPRTDEDVGAEPFAPHDGARYEADDGNQVRHHRRVGRAD